MKRRDLMKSAAVVTATAATGLAGFSNISRSAPPASAGRIGLWSGLAPWPLLPLHAVMLGDGRVLSYGSGRDGQQTGIYVYDVWDPSAGIGNNLGSGTHMTLNNTTGTDIFCSSQIVLPQSGNVLIAGGDKFVGGQTANVGNSNTNVFFPSGNSLASEGVNVQMQLPRWYATPTVLTDGRIYLQGGRGDTLDRFSNTPEIREANGVYRLLSGIDTSSINYFYPRNRVAPDGRVFGYSDLSMYYVDVNANNGAGSLAPAGNMPSDGPSGVTSCDVMYAPGKILRCGGGSTSFSEKGHGTSSPPGKNAAAVIDITGGSPVYKKQPTMPIALHWANATVMADGDVVITGGSTEDNNPKTLNTSALLWKAGSRQWTQGAQSTPGYARMYHSMAMLLVDGSVLVGGGGASTSTWTGPQTNTNVEIYYPPYLFNSSGSFAARPKILAAPARISYNTRFEVTTTPSSGISRVTLVKAGSVTHSNNFEQRFIELSFTALVAGIQVQGPANAALATPGNYLLFVFDKQGVPSIASVVPVGPAL